LSFDEFFDGFDHFSGASKRPLYWANRLEVLRRKIGNVPLIESDTVFIEVNKA
jgi:hypothetical protein